MYAEAGLDAAGIVEAVVRALGIEAASGVKARRAQL
jgi:hypothetical protein